MVGASAGDDCAKEQRDSAGAEAKGAARGSSRGQVRSDDARENHARAGERSEGETQRKHTDVGMMGSTRGSAAAGQPGEKARRSCRVAGATRRGRTKGRQREERVGETPVQHSREEAAARRGRTRSSGREENC